MHDMTTTLTARNATAADLRHILENQKAHKLDLVVPSLNFKATEGLIQVKNYGTYKPSLIFDEGLSSKLRIPRDYLRRTHDERPDLYDANVNGLLRGRLIRGTDQFLYEPDPRNFLLRLFRGDDGEEGVARALLSDTYGLTMDNLDVLVAVMKGITNAGADPLVRVTDLSERGMRVRFEFPEINTLSPAIAGNYTSPFDGGQVSRAGLFDVIRQQYGAHHIFSDKDSPLIYLAIDLVNSETGGGAYYLDPVLMMVKCTNGWIIPRKSKEGVRRVHRGATLAEGNVRASAETIKAAGKLVASETTDTVTQWLRPEYLERLVHSLEEKAEKPIATPATTVPAIVEGLGFTEDEAASVLDMFVLSGGSPTAGRLAQAVSAFAQTVEDVDRAYEIELQTIAALEAAAAR